MATARSRRWVKLVAGLLLGSAAGHLGGGGTYVRAAGPELSPTPLVQPAAAPSASAALRLAAELQQRGRYEEAAIYLRQANGQVRQLSAAENQELARLWHENFAALQQRRAASDLLLEAEQELNVGRKEEAARCLEQLAPLAAWLNAPERARYQELTQPVATVVRGAAGSAGSPEQTHAREKLREARRELGEFKLDEAEQHAREAEGFGTAWGKNEDSPRKVLEEIARIRTDGKSLLLGARQWLQRKDYARAEKLAQAAEKQGGSWNLNPFADTPARVLKDIQTARTQTGSNPIQQVSAKVAENKSTDVRPAVATAIEQAKPSTDRKSEEVRRLLNQGRKELQAGNTAAAQKLAEQARDLTADLAWWEDTPDKLLADVARGKGTVTPAKNKTQAVTQLKQARTLFSEGKFDEALEIVAQLRGQTNLSWGLFEDSPERLLQEIEKGRTQRNQATAAKILAEGRQLFNRGDLDGATRAAEQAQKLHGPYSAFDFGDRPTKLLAEIAAARQKPRPPLTQSREPELAKEPAPSPASTNPATQCQILLNDARAALKAGQAARAVQLAEQAQQLKKRHNLTPGDSPEAILAEAQKAAGVAPTIAPVVQTQSAVTPAANPKKQQANQLLASARQLQQQGKLVEARQKAQDALLLGASFGPTEDSPELAIQQINERAARVVAGLVNTAGETLANGKGDPAQIARSVEGGLQEARNLAVAFGLDTKPVDIQMTAVAQLKSAASAPPVSGGAPAPLVQNPAQPTPAPQPARPTNPGQTLLESARLELRKGELITARKMAEEAARGSFGVQEEALSVLRSIDAEEARQRALAANRSFDAARQAFQRGDYTYAGNLIAAIDVRQLDAGRQGHLREMMMTPQMQPSNLARTQPTPGTAPTQTVRTQPGVNPIPTTGNGPGAQQVRFEDKGKPFPAPPGEAPGRVTVTDQPNPLQPGVLETAAAMKEVKFQKLRQDGLKVQSEATDRFKSGDYEMALDMLQQYLSLLNDSGLEANQTSLLRRPAESRLQQFRVLKAQQELTERNTTAKENAHAAIGRQQIAEMHKQKKIEELMKQATALLKEGKYLEAERSAMQAHEIDPDNAVVSAMVFIAKRQRRGEEYAQIKSNKEEMVLGALNDAENEGDPRVIKNLITFDPARSAIAQKRTGKGSSKLLTKSLREREIENKLNTPVTLNFKDVPLYSILQDLSAIYNVPIWPNRSAMQDAGISIDRPVTIQIGNLSLKSALNLLLKDANLTWVIRDEVLQVTTMADARGKLETRTFDVTDLVIPIPDSQTPVVGTEPHHLFKPLHQNTQLGNGAGNPVNMPLSLLGGQNVGSPAGGPTLETNGSNPQKQNAKQEKELIRIIQNTLAPTSWREMGGPGTIEFLPLNNALVINQTPDIQEQVADLLAALRRLQDQEVAIEIRMITITEDFYERIGVNFNVNIINDSAQRYAPQLSQGVGQPSPNFNAFNPSRLISGLTPAGQLTNDLSIPITNQTFWQTIPQFGGYPGTGIGGVAMGLAFLSDIQVFLFLEAVQGDVRNNVMQAPKVTTFNGVQAFINVTETRPFITGAAVGLVNGTIPIFQPQASALGAGTQMFITPVISADRRFVRLTITQNLTNILPGPIPNFPVVIPVFPQQAPGTFTSPPDPILFTQNVQQPSIAQVFVNTTVMVPDGGTVLLGGLKRLSENRSEFGAPILSKIPAINRLFRNVGYGREASSLLMMVTPRIIIQEEEEERATGYIDRPLIGTVP